MNSIHIGWIIGIIAVLNTGACFFSVCVITLRGFSPGKLSETFESIGKKSAMNAIVEQTEDLIWTSSCLRVFFNCLMLLAVVFAFEQSGSAGLGVKGYILVFLVCFAVFSVFSVAVAHSLAKYAGEAVLCRIYPLLKVLSAALVPVKFIFTLFDKFIRRLSGLPEATEEQVQEEKQEEFLTDLKQLRIEGTVDREEQKMIQGVLKLSQTTAEEIMTPRTDISAVELHSSLEDIIGTITTAGHTRVPVYNGDIDNIIGFVYAKDLLGEIGKDTEKFELSDKLRKPYFVPETKILRELLHEFQLQKLHISVILDEYGGTAGIVTLEDILEELVGEIADEYEATPPEQVTQVDADTFEVDARAYINDVNEQYELDLPEGEDYDTVGGFVFSYLGYIPKPGTVFDYNQLRFKITSAEPRRINYLKIKKLKSRIENKKE